MTRPTVLIVEDEPWLAEGYAAALDKAGWQPVVVRTAADAIIAVDDHTPIAIILDIMLPHVNGVQLLHELKSYADLGTIPVIVCSSIANSFKADQLKTYGVRKVLPKVRVTPTSLVASLREVLAESAAV